MTTNPTTDDIVTNPSIDPISESTNTKPNTTDTHPTDSGSDSSTVIGQTSEHDQTGPQSHADDIADNQDVGTHNEQEDVVQTTAQLEKKLAEYEAIAKKAQYDYINAKMDLDRLQKRLSEQESEGKVTQLIEVIKKLIPAFEDLRNSVEHIPADQADTPLAKGINIVYANITKILNSMGITAISSLGIDPDSELHEPMGLQSAPSEDQKGKIISEFARAYVYEKNDKRIVVQSAKVIIGE